MTKKKLPVGFVLYPKFAAFVARAHQVGAKGRQFRSLDLVTDDLDPNYVAKSMYKLVGKRQAHIIEYRRNERGGNPYPIFKLGPGPSVQMPAKEARVKIVAKPVSRPVVTGARPFGVPDVWTAFGMGQLPPSGVTATRPPHWLDTDEDRMPG